MKMRHANLLLAVSDLTLARYAGCLQLTPPPSGILRFHAPRPHLLAVDPVTNLLYVSSTMKEVLPNDPANYYRHMLWAIDIRTGGIIRTATIAESRHTCPQAGQMCQFVDYISGPTLPQSTAEDAGADGVLRFQVLRHLQRCGLELYNGIVVVAFAGYDGALPATRLPACMVVRPSPLTHVGHDAAVWVARCSPDLS
jgi:hypothetical protein